MAKIIDGKAVSMKIKEELKEKVLLMKEKGKVPGLAVIVAGNDPASKIYVKNKHKDCEYIGINSYEYSLDENVSEEELLSLIKKLNEDEKVNGILVQLPLPRQINQQKILESINPKKDVDAFHPENVGKIMIGNYSFLPCTPAGVMELLKSIDAQITGRNCVVLGRSNIVGKPMAMLLIENNGTVTICHSKTKNLKEIVKNADILISAVGKAKFVTNEMVKEGSIVIDVGMNRDENGNLCGDVDFESVKDKVSAITPVPGGVGPMTRAVLMKNTVKAALMQWGEE